MMKNHYFLPLLVAAMLCALPAQAQTPAARAAYVQRTNLPALYIETSTGQDPASKENYVPCTVTYVDGGSATTYELTDDGIRGRGNSTWDEAKKRPWRLKFNKKVALLGSDFAKAKSWTLLANAFDKSLMQNALTYHLGRMVGLAFNPCYRFVDLYMNGDYRGTYQISDQVEVRDKRVPGDEDTTWLLEYANSSDKVEDPKVNFTIGGQAVGYVEIKNPGFTDDKLSSNPELAEAIRAFVNNTLGTRLNPALQKYDYADPYKGLRAVVDTASLVNWYIATELTANWDGLYSVFCYRDNTEGAPLHFGPLWDEDLAYGNHTETYDRNYFPQQDFYDKLLADCNFIKGMVSENSYRRLQPEIAHLWDDPWFANAVNMRFNALVNGGLQQELEQKIDELKAELTQSAAENYKRWRISTDDPGYAPVANRRDWATTVDNLRKFIGTRIAVLKKLFAEKNANNHYIDENMDWRSVDKEIGQWPNSIVNRTAKAGMWNTLCLPHELSENRIKYYFGEGSVVEEFTGVTEQAGAVTLHFKKVERTEGGKPYLVRPTRDVDRPFPFYEIGLKTDGPFTIAHDGYQFTGTYAPTRLAEDGTQLFVGAGNKLLTPVSGSSPLKALRAYFTLPAAAAAAKVNLSFDGVATGIDGLTPAAPSSAVRIYNLNGQYVGTDLTRLGKGVYIINGKKTVKQ